MLGELEASPGVLKTKKYRLGVRPEAPSFQESLEPHRSGDTLLNPCCLISAVLP